jgi:hypothetical protein
MIKFLVEGDGEVRSLPILLSRVNKHRAVSFLDMEGKSNIIRRKNGFENTIIRQKELGYTEFIILIDSDVKEPYNSHPEEMDDMTKRTRDLEKREGINIKLFWAIREYESWIVGGIRRGDHFCNIIKTIKGVPGDTEASPSDPKEWLIKHRADKRYKPSDQACFTKHFDISLAKTRNSSLRKFLENI